MPKNLSEAKKVAESWLGCHKQEFCEKNECSECENYWTPDDIIEALYVFTKKNVVEVTFCEDCIYWDTDEYEANAFLEEHEEGYGYCKYNIGITHKSGYCDAGE